MNDKKIIYLIVGKIWDSCIECRCINYIYSYVIFNIVTINIDIHFPFFLKSEIKIINGKGTYHYEKINV